MASTKRNAHGRWLARWKDAAGQWRCTAAAENTKRSAQRLAEELEAAARRQLAGLEPLPPSNGGGTVAELLAWWIEAYSRRLASAASIASSVRLHLLPARLASLTLQAVRPADVRAFLDEKEAEGLSPQTLNHLRGFVSRAFNRAIEVGRWPGDNPVARVKKKRVPRSVAGGYLRPTIKRKRPRSPSLRLPGCEPERLGLTVVAVPAE